MKIPGLISSLAVASLVLFGTSCSDWKRMPGKYVIYDVTEPSSAKSYVEFYTDPPNPNVLAQAFSGKDVSRIKIVKSGKEKLMGYVGSDGCERLLLVLPPGEQQFRVGPGVNDAEINIVTRQDKVIPVETNSSANVGAQVVGGLIGYLATAKGELKVGPAKPYNPNERNWIPLK